MRLRKGIKSLPAILLGLLISRRREARKQPDEDGELRLGYLRLSSALL